MADGKRSYADILRDDFNTLFESLKLQDLQRHFFLSCFLYQVILMEKKFSQCQQRYYRLRLTAIVLGVIVPVLVGIEFRNDSLNQVKKFVTIGLSTVVAASAAVEEFFHYGERWNHYRRTVESLKTQGWQFSQLTGPYQDFDSHEAAFYSFADQVEDIIQRDVEVYVTQLATPKNKKQQEDEEG